MKSMQCFSVRNSGRLDGYYYIDCAGFYETVDIAAMTGINKNEIEFIYISEGAFFDEKLSVFYFHSRDAALNSIRKLGTKLSSKGAGRFVFLTYDEIEYIRQALINEGSNIIYVRNDVKKCIFDKLNT